MVLPEKEGEGKLNVIEYWLHG